MSLETKGGRARLWCQGQSHGGGLPLNPAGAFRGPCTSYFRAVLPGAKKAGVVTLPHLSLKAVPGPALSAHTSHVGSCHLRPLRESEAAQMLLGAAACDSTLRCLKGTSSPGGCRWSPGVAAADPSYVTICERCWHRLEAGFTWHLPLCWIKSKGKVQSGSRSASCPDSRRASPVNKIEGLVPAV